MSTCPNCGGTHFRDGICIQCGENIRVGGASDAKKSGPGLHLSKLR